MQKVRELISKATFAVVVVQDPLTFEIGYTDLGQPPTMENLKAALNGVCLFSVVAMVGTTPVHMHIDEALPVESAQEISRAISAHFTRLILDRQTIPNESRPPDA